MEFNQDYFIDPVIRTLPQKVLLVKNGTSAIEVARNATAQYEKLENWDEPFFVCDLGIVLAQYKRWKLEFPNVQPYYAVKANSLTPLLNALAALGNGFDCASKNEVNHVLSCGVSPDRIIFANPNKMSSHLCDARKNDVKKMTFDNLEELVKVKRYFPEASLVLRLFVDDSKARSNFSCKFGATMDYCKLLIKKAKELDLSIIGIAYHIGSGSPDVNSFVDANLRARELFDFAKTVGFDFNFLDIGGGFPGKAKDNKVIPFETICQVIRKSLDEHFPPSSGVKIIAEPGRFFPSPAISLVTNVHGKKKINSDMSYYVTDGVYNSFFVCIFEGREHLSEPTPLHEASKKRETFNTIIFGPTMDGNDFMKRDILLPEMMVGEWLVWKEMGSYAAMLSVGFNGFQTCKAKYFITKEKWAELRELCELPSLLPETIN